MAAALNEEHLVVCRNAEKFAKVLLCRIQDVLKQFGAMAHFHHRHSGSLVVEHLFCRFPQHFLRKHCRSGTEIIYTCHPLSSPLEKRKPKQLLTITVSYFD